MLHCLERSVIFQLASDSSVGICFRTNCSLNVMTNYFSALWLTDMQCFNSFFSFFFCVLLRLYPISHLCFYFQPTLSVGRVDRHRSCKCSCWLSVRSGVRFLLGGAGWLTNGHYLKCSWIWAFRRLTAGSLEHLTRNCWLMLQGVAPVYAVRIYFKMLWSKN